MANVIKIKRSATASATPNTLEHGELGLNYADGKLFYKNLSNSIVQFTGSVGPKGDAGVAGLAVQSTAPVDTTVLWADTSVSGTAVVPTGGTTGQVLAKSSGSDYATTWTTPVTSSDLALKANLVGPTFTGTVTLPSDTSIGTVSATEIGYLDGVTSAIQTQLNTKASTGKAIAMAIVFGG
jgi:hypothetical protein